MAIEIVRGLCRAFGPSAGNALLDWTRTRQTSHRIALLARRLGSPVAAAASNHPGKFFRDQCHGSPEGVAEMRRRGNETVIGSSERKPHANWTHVVPPQIPQPMAPPLTQRDLGTLSSHLNLCLSLRDHDARAGPGCGQVPKPDPLAATVGGGGRR
ncbi:hypothetical protein BU16DRAFT_554303 [Lophium mytilinum]|uniref:Uncharacterized protein n=1 Tax=Lophium mytilinum TaxID=390894 RepID=A0A6A6RCF8_9PEZI|nr:hypothetical protein BU16DRAFT_554303 [Lophium mytilinum]